MYPVSFKDHPLASQIDEIRHHNFMKLARPHLISGLFSAALVYILCQGMASTSEALLWLFANILLSLCSVIFYVIYYKKPTLFSISGWGRVTLAVAVLWGLCWALPPFILLDAQQNLYLGLMATFMVAMAAVPAPVMVHYPLAYVAFISFPLGSLWAKTLVSDLQSQFVMQWLTPFLWVSLLIYGWDLHKTIIESIRLRLEHAKAQQEAELANVAKSKFIAAASHDIRQPLQASALFLHALKNLPEGQSPTPLLSQLEKSMDGMSELINSLLDVSKLDALAIDIKPQHCSLDLLFERLQCTHIKQAKNKGLPLKVESQSLAVYCDCVHLERVLSNLLSNAIRYTHQGFVSISAKRKGDGVCIEVADTGMGIPETETDNVFDEFYQLGNPERNEVKGLGLGLSIVKRLCDIQHWPLVLRSVLGQGSKFSITVPTGDMHQITAQANSDVTNLNQIFAVIVEDNREIRDGLTKLMKSWGASAISVSNIESLKYALERSHSKDINLVISDYRLPDNRLGTEAVKLVREHQNNHVEAVLITGDTAPSELQNMSQSDMVILHKPVKPGQLRAVLQKKFYASEITGHAQVTGK